MTVAPVYAGLYKWTDAAGRTNFSDRPPADEKAEEVKIRSFVGPATVIAVDAPIAVTEVKLYTTTWCGVCKRARAHLARLGVRYTEYDVETTAIGRTEYKRLNGRGVPVILVGDRRMDGFDARSLEQMLVAAGLWRAP